MFRYDPAIGKTVSWNVAASEVDVATETEALLLLVKETGYYDQFNVVDLDEVSLLAMHHMCCNYKYQQLIVTTT